MLFELFFHYLINFASVELFISLFQFFFANDEDFLLLKQKLEDFLFIFKESLVYYCCRGVRWGCFALT